MCGLFLKFDFIIRFQTARYYFEDFTLTLKAEQELLLNTINQFSFTIRMNSCSH